MSFPLKKKKKKLQNIAFLRKRKKPEGKRIGNENNLKVLNHNTGQFCYLFVVGKRMGVYAALL